VGVFGPGYVRVDLWGKFIEVCEWCNGCEIFFNFFLWNFLIFIIGVKCKFTNLPLYLKIFKQ